MAHHCRDAHSLRTLLLVLWLARAGQVFASTDTNVAAQLQALQQQNEMLQKQLREQQEVIDSLRRDVAGIQQASQQRDTATGAGQAEALGGGDATPASGSFGKVHLSGEGGAGLFETGSQGFSPNWEFRLDEARLFVDAQAWNNVYAYAELNLATRESPELGIYLGEAYVDAEDISQLWGRPGQLNARLGRLYIPFGEEYLNRYAINNPLISHSLSDLWGYDQGFELYGAAGKFSYVAAVQNGGGNPPNDFTADKSLAGRFSYDPNRHLHFSISGMRTGDLSAQGDQNSALWFSEGYIVPLGTSTLFHANLAEFDAAWRMPRGQLSAFGGYIRYNDNEHNGRDIYYYQVEGVHDLTEKLYAAARFSQIFAPGGYPIVANSMPSEYWWGPVTDRIWRLSLGLGYRWNRNFILKSEYCLERGKEVSGENRDHEDLFATEAVFAF